MKVFSKGVKRLYSKKLRVYSYLSYYFMRSLYMHTHRVGTLQPQKPTSTRRDAQQRRGSDVYHHPVSRRAPEVGSLQRPCPGCPRGGRDPGQGHLPPPLCVECL